MKKLFSLLLMVNLLIVSFPTSFMAVEENEVKAIDDVEMRQMVIQKAIEAFPEYKKEILGENEITISNARTVLNDKVVIEETRMLSENEMVAYTQYESGASTMALGFVAGKDVTVTGSTSYYTRYSMDAWITHSLSSTMLYVQDIEFIIYNDSYDRIENRGTLGSDGAFLGIREYETSAQPACVEYRGWFYYDAVADQQLVTTRILRVQVGSDNWSVSIASDSVFE